MIDPKELDEMQGRCDATGKDKWSVENKIITREPNQVIGSICGNDNSGYYPSEAEARDILDFIIKARTDMPRLIVDVRQLSKALGFYADYKNWSVETSSNIHGHVMSKADSICQKDYGELARKTLENK